MFFPHLKVKIMKHKILITLFLISIFSCKKQIEQMDSIDSIQAGYLSNVKTYLKDSLRGSDYASIDFTHGSLSKQKDGWYLRLKWLHKTIDGDFLLLQTDSLGNCIQGRIIHLDKDGNSDQSVFNGNISIESLNRILLINSFISNGYVQALHPLIFSGITTNSSNVEPFLIPAPVYQALPEVVVVGYIPSKGSGLTYGELMSFESMFNFGYGYGYSSPGGGSASSGGGSGSGNSGGNSGIYSPIGGGGGGGIQPSQDVRINYETSTWLPAINIHSYMNCFAAIPDAGAQCSVTIYTDLPVNDDPTMIFNFNTGAVGHSFLQLTKSGSGQSVTQVIGFTATKPFQAMISPGAVPSKIVDNQGHKYNASLRMNITPAQLSTEISTIETLSSSQYDIINYNCVNFSVQVLNAIRLTNPLVVPLMQIPGATPLSSTPEGLYVLLSRMKEGGPEALNILTDEILWSGSSHGACN
jgi:hypothetical protein